MNAVVCMGFPHNPTAPVTSHHISKLRLALNHDILVLVPGKRFSRRRAKQVVYTARRLLKKP